MILVMKSRSYHHGDLKNALIEAGIGILDDRGLSGLSLRKVAERVGVSHAAPYAHFSDKQELVAAIATHGFRQLHGKLTEAIAAHPRRLRLQLLATVKAYAAFAVENTETFKLMFSSTIEKEKEHEELITVVQEVTDLVNVVVSRCVDRDAINASSPELIGVIIWGQVHGIILLWVENQIPGKLLKTVGLMQLVQIAIEYFLVKKRKRST